MAQFRLDTWRLKILPMLGGGGIAKSSGTAARRAGGSNVPSCRRGHCKPKRSLFPVAAAAEHHRAGVVLCGGAHRAGQYGVFSRKKATSKLRQITSRIWKCGGEKPKMPKKTDKRAQEKVKIAGANGESNGSPFKFWNIAQELVL